ETKSGSFSINGSACQPNQNIVCITGLYERYLASVGLLLTCPPGGKNALNQIDLHNESNMVIDPELERLIRPLSEEEHKGLERNLRRHGCRDPLVVWRRPDGKLVLLDGHHRYRICVEYNLPYSFIVLDLPSLEAAIQWILENQLDRRNLDRQQRAKLAAQ